MLGLPKTTEVNRSLPKKAIVEKFALKSTDRQRLDEEIHKLTIVNEISPRTVNIAAGTSTTAFYVVLLDLRGKECSDRNIIKLSKAINQNILFVLEQEDGRASLAIYRAEKVIRSDRRPANEWSIELTGLDLDRAWENIIAVIGNIDVAEGRTLDEQITADAEHERLLQNIVRLERKARAEKQPRQKWEMAQEVEQLKNMLEG